MREPDLLASNRLPPEFAPDPGSDPRAGASLSSGYADLSDAVGIKDFIGVLRRQWLLIAAVAFACVSVTAYLVYTAPPMYRTAALIRLIDQRRALTGGIEGAALERVAGPQFVIEPLYRVAVGGEVRKPDLYSLAPVTAVAQAVALAGGPTERGRLDNVRLLRDGRGQVLDLTRPEAGAAASTIRSGDQLRVPRRVSIFRDYIAPASGLMATAVSLTGILTRK